MKDRPREPDDDRPDQAARQHDEPVKGSDPVDRLADRRRTETGTDETDTADWRPDRTTGLSYEVVTGMMDASSAALDLPREPMAQYRDAALTDLRNACEQVLVEGTAPNVEHAEATRMQAARYFGIGVASAETGNLTGVLYAADGFADIRTRDVKKLFDETSPPSLIPADRHGVTEARVREVLERLGGLIGDSELERNAMLTCWKEGLEDPDSGIRLAESYRRPDHIIAGLVGAGLGAREAHDLGFLEALSNMREDLYGPLEGSVVFGWEIEPHPDGEVRAQDAFDRLYAQQERIAKDLPARIWADMQP